MNDLLYKLNEKAMKLYHIILYRSYHTALSYLGKRNLKLGAINDLMIGYANNDYSLYDYLRAEGFNDNVILSSGLVVKDEEGNYIDRYQNRIIFPIKDVDSKLVAFGGRVIDNSTPKYINNADSEIYCKAENLYGINISKDYAQDGLIIVEGYFDFITLYQAGIKNVVALLGTAITDEQIELIKKYTNKVTLILDSDLAGQQASIRAVEKIKKYDIKCFNVRLEKAKDVDEFINIYGIDEFKKLLQNDDLEG